MSAFGYAFVQRGLLEVVLLSVAAGVLGTWIVARGLAFFSHAVAAAAFPGLVLSAGIGFLLPATGYRDIYTNTTPAVPGFTPTSAKVDAYLYSAILAGTFTY